MPNGKSLKWFFRVGDNLPAGLKIVLIHIDLVQRVDNLPRLF